MTPSRLLATIVSCCVFASSSACTASADDCASLGDKYVELFMSSQSEDAMKLGVEVLGNAAEAGREEIIAYCKAHSTPKASVKRCLAATSMDEFHKC